MEKLPEYLLESDRVSAPHRPVDDEAADRQDGERDRPEHRQHESAGAEPFGAVDAMKQRLVGIGVLLDQRSGPGIKDYQAILAAARFTEIDRDRRLVAFELRGDPVDRRAGRALPCDGHRLRDRIGPGLGRRRRRYGARQIAGRLAQRFRFAEEFRERYEEARERRKQQEERRRKADPAMPSPPPRRVHAPYSISDCARGASSAPGPGPATRFA